MKRAGVVIGSETNKRRQTHLARKTLGFAERTLHSR